MDRRWQVIAVLLAWVFWTKTIMDPDQGRSGWEVVGAWETKAECEQAKAQRMKTIKSNWEWIMEKGKKLRPDIAHENWMRISEDSGTLKTPGLYVDVTLFCLPDTIDPREKKE